MIELYKKGQYSANSDTKNPIKFMDNGDFDAFVVYELDGNEIPRKHPTASGYLKGQLLLVLYDFFTGRGNRLTTPIPDGYVEDAKCFVTAEKPVSWLILDIVEEIANKRLPQPKK